MGMVPEVAGGDARLRAAGSSAHGRVRRLLGRLAFGAAERHGLRGSDHPGRGVAEGLAGAAEAERGRGAGRGARREAGGRAAPDGQRRADAVEGRDAWWHELVADESDDAASCPCEPMDSEDLLYLLYTSRDDGEAEGDRPHDRRLPGRRGDDAPLHLRRQARLGVLVRGRRRLGDRALVHRLRALVQRDDRRDVRGRAGLPGQGSLVGDRRALQGGHPVHGPDGDPLTHEVGHASTRTSTTCPRSGCWARSGSRSTRRRGSGTGR